jgi:hypothetical protein
MMAWRDYISHEIDVSNVVDADFHFPNMQLMSHWVEQIHPYGTLQQHSAERHEQAHKMNLKDSWNTCNHNLNYLPQVITFQRRMLCLGIRELNLKAVAHRQENIAAACKVLPSGAHLATPPGSKDYAKPEFMGPRNHCDVHHPDAIIKDFRALPDNTQGGMHSLAIYTGTREFIKDESHNKTYISDEQLHAMELCIYHGNKVQVEGLDGERISLMCQCTVSQSWHGWDRRKDWVWVQQHLGMCCGTLNGRLP